MNIILFVMFFGGIIIAVLALNFGAKLKDRIDEQGKQIRNKLENIEHFFISHSFVDEFGITGIAIDESRDAICLVFWEQQSLDFRVLKYKDVLSCELYEDGQTVTKTSRSSQIGGALIGGLALGATGAIIGGLSAKTVSETGMIKHIDLRLVVNDMKKPCHDLNFFSRAKNAPHLQASASESARHWYGLITVIIKKADQEDQADKKSFDATQPAVSKKQIELDACANCGEQIGRLEKVFTFKEEIVCGRCNQKLSG